MSSAASTAPRAAARGNARTIWSWALYDFANSPFTTIVITFIYPVYFAQVIVADDIEGTALWSRAATITAIVVALASPFLGALADRGGYRKAFVLISTAVAVAATAALYTVLPGGVLMALAFVVIANIAFEFGGVFYNAFLPDIAPPSRVGSISGWAWGLGYFGGLLALVVALFTLVTSEPLFGFGTEQGENVRATALLAAVWFAVFTIPFLLFVREDRTRRSARGRVLAETVAQLVGTLKEIRKHREIWRFLIARLVFNDGLVTIFAFGGIYAAGTFGFSLSPDAPWQRSVIVFGIVINLAAGLGAIAMGFLDDRLGGKKTIVISLLGLIGATTLAVLARDAVWLWVAGIFIGIFSGPNQSASRSLMARFVPHDSENEFFGFFAFSGKVTAFIGPFLLGVLTDAFDSQRVGISVVIVMFVVGLLLLLRVDEREGAKLRT